MPRRRLHRALRLGPLAFLIAASLAVSSASAGPQRRIGVVVTVTVATSDNEAEQLAAELGDAIGKNLPVDVIAGAEASRRLPAAGLPAECVAQAECRSDLGRRLDADELLLLVMVRTGDSVQIDPTWADVASGDVRSREQIVVAEGAERGPVWERAVPRLLPHIRPAQATKPEVVVVTTPGEPARDDGGRHMELRTWIAGGVSVAALVGGGVFALTSQRKFSDLDDMGCRSIDCDPDDIDSLRAHSLTADILFGVSAGAAVTAVVFYLLSDDDGETGSPAETTVRVGPSSGGVGVSLGGRF